MNLSQRLDAARRQRDLRPGDEDTYVLRMRHDATTYDGRDLRTGSELSDADWEARRRLDTEGLPTWQPGQPTGPSFAELDDPIIDLRHD